MSYSQGAARFLKHNQPYEMRPQLAVSYSRLVAPPADLHALRSQRCQAFAWKRSHHFWQSHPQQSSLLSSCAARAAAAGPSAGPADRPSFSDLKDTQRMVEAAMLAAVGGLVFTTATVLRLSTYMVYFMPLPVVLSARRNGAFAAQMTAVTTAILLTVLLGPIQAATYMLNFGVVSMAMGALWTTQVSWLPIVLVCGALRILGQVGLLVLSSWAMNENLFTLMLHSLHNLLDQCSAALGMSGAPEPAAIAIVAGIMLSVNAFLYMSMLQVLYTMFFRSMGMSTPTMPAFLERRLSKRS